MRTLRVNKRKLTYVVWGLGTLLFLFPLSALAQSEIGYTAIPVSEMKKMLDSGAEILIVDVLSKSTYTKEHIPGAKNFEFPNETMDQWNKSKTTGKTQDEFISFLGENKDRPIIFYCLDEKWVRSHCGASWALKMGYKKVYRCVEGISAWKKAGYPVEK